MKTRKVFSAVLAFVMLVIISGCSSEKAVKTNSEDEVTESTKSNTVITETTTEATEATTVLSTKDGITLENAPKLEDNTLETPSYPVTINGENYIAEPWNAKYRKHGSEDFIWFDTLYVNIIQEEYSNVINGLYYTATIDGKDYYGETLEEQRELNQAFKEKYPNFNFSNEKSSETSEYTLYLKGAEEIQICINSPDDKRIYSKLTLNIADINNSYIYSAYRNTCIETSGTISNSALLNNCVNPHNSILNYNNLKKCSVINYWGYEYGNVDVHGVLDISFNSGEDNEVYVYIENINKNTNPTIDPTVKIGGVASTWFLIDTRNSMVKVFEDHENPNFNSQINLAFDDPYDNREEISEETKALEKKYQDQVIKDLSSGDLVVGTNTNDLDNTPVFVIIDWANIAAEVQTGGLYGEISSDFLLNAPIDGSVYNLTE
jgi:uncharacterized protein YcfL